MFSSSYELNEAISIKEGSLRSPLSKGTAEEVKLTLDKHAHTHSNISAVVVGEIVRARLFRYRGRGFWDGDVLKVEEAEFHLHAD